MRIIPDIFRKIVEKTSTCRLTCQNEDNFQSKGYFIKGEVFWSLKNMETGDVKSGKFLNVVTLDASVLVARLMKGLASPVAHQSEPNFGILALAVGTGNGSWDPLHPPPALNTQRSLWNELGRKIAQSTQFINSDGMVSGIPTNIVDFNFNFTESEAIGPLCEMGLIGGDINSNMSIINPVLPPNGSYDPTVNLFGKDTLVNYLTFGVISKTNNSQLGWTWRLTF
jgi:hypothetical protein